MYGRLKEVNVLFCECCACMLLGNNTCGNHMRQLHFTINETFMWVHLFGEHNKSPTLSTKLAFFCAKDPQSRKTKPSVLSFNHWMTASVILSHPCPWWEFALWALTVRQALSSKTPVGWKKWARKCLSCIFVQLTQCPVFHFELQQNTICCHGNRVQYYLQAIYEQW